MKYYLIILLLIIMGAGARTMFEIAHNALGMEPDFAPDKETTLYMLLTLWYILMMVADVLLLFYKQVRYRNALIALLTIGIIAPTLYMYFTK